MPLVSADYHFKNLWNQGEALFHLTKLVVAPRDRGDSISLFFIAYTQ
jgi:hypothetical protein